jgi:hypothetical protein
VVNPKGQAKKTEEQAEISTEQEEPQAEAVVKNPLDEVLSQAQRAYTAYMDATREVSRIYRENEIQIGDAYVKAAQEANQACEASVKQAEKAREQAEKRARDAYQRALENAEKTAEEAIAQALKTREEDIAKAWGKREETVAQAWDIYTKVVR